MKSDISLQSITSGISKTLHRYHVVLFTVLVIGGVAAMIFMINQTIIRSTDTTDQQQNDTSMNFDQATIEQLEELDSDASNPGPLALPEGKRISPFVEP